MFESTTTYPCALSDNSDDGVVAAISWVQGHVESGQHLTLWIAQKNVLDHNELARTLASTPGVRLAVGRGTGHFVANGPVLALFANADDLGNIVGRRGISALCVVQSSDALTTWAKEVGAEVIHELDLDDEDRELYGFEEAVDLTPALVEGLERMTSSINHNNTIKAGYEKGTVVRGLLELHDAGLHLPPQEMKEWAVAHGWRGENPKHLGDLIGQINSGSRPRH